MQWPLRPWLLRRAPVEPRWHAAGVPLLVSSLDAVGLNTADTGAAGNWWHGDLQGGPGDGETEVGGQVGRSWWNMKEHENGIDGHVGKCYVVDMSGMLMKNKWNVWRVDIHDEYQDYGHYWNFSIALGLRGRSLPGVTLKIDMFCGNSSSNPRLMAGSMLIWRRVVTIISIIINSSWYKHV